MLSKKRVGCIVIMFTQQSIDVLHGLRYRHGGGFLCVFYVYLNDDLVLFSDHSPINNVTMMKGSSALSVILMISIVSLILSLDFVYIFHMSGHMRKVLRTGRQKLLRLRECYDVRYSLLCVCKSDPIAYQVKCFIVVWYHKIILNVIYIYIYIYIINPFLTYVVKI